MNACMVPSSLEDLGLVMEESEQTADIWGRNSREDLLPSDPLTFWKNHNSETHGMQVGAAMAPGVCHVLDPYGQRVGTVKPKVGNAHQPGALSGSKISILQSMSRHFRDAPVPNHTPELSDGKAISRQPVILDRVWHQDRLEFVSNAARNPKYVLVPDKGMLGSDLNALGKVVRLEMMANGDPKQVRYIMNEIVMGPTSDVPTVASMNPNGIMESGNPSGYGTHPGPHPGHVVALPPWLHDVQYGSASYGHQIGAASMENHQAAPEMLPQLNPVMQSTGGRNGRTDASQLRAALLGTAMSVVGEAAFREYMNKKGKEHAKARKSSTTPRSRGSKGVLSDLQPTSAVEAPKRQRQRKRKEKGNETTALTGQAKKTYSRKRAGAPVLEGEAEEIVVEVDVPMMFSDDEESDEGRDPESRDAEGEDEVQLVECGDPLAPSSEEYAAVENMRRQKKAGSNFQFTLLNWRKKLVLMPKQVKVLDGKTSVGRGHKMPSKSSLPMGLKECYVRLERCDAPRATPNHDSRKGDSSSGDGKEGDSTQSKGPDPVVSVPSTEEPSPTVSPSKTPRGWRQEADYWLKMLERERREAFEALEVVRKRLDEEKSACDAALMSVRSSVLEKEFPLEDSTLSTSLDERRWTLLEEEFRRRDAMKRKSVLESSDISVVEAAPVTSADAKVTESKATDSRSAKDQECQRSRRASGSKKMQGWRKADSPVSSSQEGSSKAEDACPLNMDLSKDESCTSMALPHERLAVPDRAIRDPRIAKLREKYRAEKSAKGGVPGMRECCVKLERLDSRAVVKSASGSRSGSDYGGGEDAVNGSSRMVLDSVEMRTLSVTTEPIQQGDSVSQTSYVCLQGRVGLKRSCESDPIAKGRSLVNPLDETATPLSASSPPQRRFLSLQMNKLVVVINKLDKSMHVPALESQRLPALEGPQMVREPELHNGQMEGKRDASTELARPQLKQCYVLLERCDKVNISASSSSPPKKRRKRIL